MSKKVITAEQYRVALAWELYCFETQGGMDVRDFWDELPKYVREMYLKMADEKASSTSDCESHTD